MIFLLKNFIYFWFKYEAMRYKNLIIKCKNNQEFVELQKHLFRLSYSWCDYGNKNRQIKNRGDNYSILIQNDDRIRRPINEEEEFKLYKVTDFIRLIRKEKLKRINNEG